MVAHNGLARWLAQGVEAAVVSGILIAGCGRRPGLEEPPGGLQPNVAAAGTGGRVTILVTVGGGGGGEDVPVAPGSDGCNARLTPTIGHPSPAAFAATGPWQLCGTFGVGGATVVKSSDDGRRVALVTDSGQVWVLDAHSFRLLGTFSHGDGPISFAGLSPDGTMLATVDAAVGQVGLWDVESHTLLRTLPLPGAAVSYYGLGDVAFSHDGEMVAVVSSERIDVFDAATAEPLPISGRTDMGGAMRVAFVAGDARLVLARFRYWGNGPYAGWGSVDVVDATTGDNLVHLDKPLGIALPAIAVSGDGDTLAVGASEPGSRSVTFFDARTGQMTGEQASAGVPLGLDQAGLNLAMLEPQPGGDGSGVSSAPALTVTVRRTSDGLVLSSLTIDAGASSPRRKLLVATPDLSALLVGDVGERVLVRQSLASGEPMAVACAAGHASDVADLAISRDGRVLVSTGDSTDGARLQWEVVTGASLSGPSPRSLREGSTLSRNGALEAAPVASDGFFDLRDISSGTVLRRLGPQPTHPRTFDFAPDASLIASASERDPIDRQRGPVADVWFVDSGELQQALPVMTSRPETSAQPVLFGNDGRHLLVGGLGSTALWCR